MKYSNLWLPAGIAAMLLAVARHDTPAQRVPIPFTGGGQVGRFVVARADKDAIVILDTMTGKLYKATDADMKKFSDLPKVEGPVQIPIPFPLPADKGPFKDKAPPPDLEPEPKPAKKRPKDDDDARLRDELRKREAELDAAKRAADEAAARAAAQRERAEVARREALEAELRAREEAERRKRDEEKKNQK